MQFELLSRWFDCGHIENARATRNRQTDTILTTRTSNIHVPLSLYRFCSTSVYTNNKPYHQSMLCVGLYTYELDIASCGWYYGSL